MANLKDALTRVLDPLIDKIAKEISIIKNSIDTTKSINVVSYGIDNTGATDVSEKLNKLFLKVSKEKYQEVIFPDGTYKIENAIKIFCPEKMNRSLKIRTESTYGATIICEHTDSSQSDTIGFTLTRNAPEDTSEIINAYNTTIDGLVFKVKNQDGDGSKYKFIGTDSSLNNLLFTNINLLNLRMTNTKDCAGNNIDIGCICNNLTIDNVKANYGMYVVYLEQPGGVNNKISNIVSNNCTFSISSYSYDDWENVTIHYDDDFNLDNGTVANFYANKVSNFKLTGRWALTQNPLWINVGPRPELSNIVLDITLDNENKDHVVGNDNKVMAFIYLYSPESAKLEVKVSNLKFEKFQENFSDWIDKGLKFSWINSPELSISPNGVEEFSSLTLFENLGSVDEYSSKGFLNRKYEIRAEDGAKTRIYLGYDRTIREESVASTDELAQNEGSAIFFGSNGVPHKDAKGHDYSNYTAGVAGDIYLESKPKDSGHFGYVSTYKYTTKTEYLPKDDKPISITNYGDRTATLAFNKFPVWGNGTLKDTPITVGTMMNVLGKGAFKVIETNVEAKTLKCEIPEPYDPNIISTMSDLSMEIYFIPDKPVNTMGVMTYETIPIIHSGPTEKRPTENIAIGQQYFDTTLGLQVIWNGTKWIANNVDIDEKLKEYIRKDKITATDITKTPDFLGQVAVSGGQIYIAKSLDLGGAGWNVIRTESIDTL